MLIITGFLAGMFFVGVQLLQTTTIYDDETKWAFQCSVSKMGKDGWEINIMKTL
jgi:hypothetical protein